jgi:hypothetical protein
MLWQVIPEPHSKTIAGVLIPLVQHSIVVLNNYNITYNTAKIYYYRYNPVIADLPQTSTIDCTATPALL